MLRSQTKVRGQRGDSSLVCLDASFFSSSLSLPFSLEVLLNLVLDKGIRFPVGVISPRKLPDDGGGYPEGAVLDVFQGEVRQAFDQLKPPCQLRMTNLTWSEEMRNKTSPAFLSMSTKVEKETKEVFKDFDAANMTTVVTELLPGSVIVRQGQIWPSCNVQPSSRFLIGGKTEKRLNKTEVEEILSEHFVAKVETV